MTDLLFSANGLKNIFIDFECEKTSKSWIIKKTCFNGDVCNIQIDKEVIKNLLNKSQYYEYKNYSLFRKRGYNKSDIFEHVVYVQRGFVYEIEPYETKTLSVSIGEVSNLYSLFLYLRSPISLIDKVRIDEKLDEFGNQTVDFWKFIKILNEEIFNLNLLQIKSLIPLSLSSIDRLCKAYTFNIAYKRNGIISMLKSIEKELTPVYRGHMYSSDKLLSLNINKEILIYYMQAIKESDPLLIFLSIYHIFEYFFKFIEDEIKNDIIFKESTKFELSNENLKNIILGNSFKSEKQLLELLFRKFLDKNELKKELNFNDKKYYSYLENSKVKFAGAKSLDDNNFYETLSSRIYSIRNALVHRKEGVEKPKYLPFEKEHRIELKKELLLMESIANQIIIKSSDKFSY